MKKKSWIDSRILYTLVILILLAGAIFGLIRIKHYLGYAMLNATGGTITELDFSHTTCSSVWGGYYGMAIMVFNYSGSLTGDPEACEYPKQKHLLFPCMSRTDNEVYASLKQSSDIDWNSVVAATPEDVDAYLNISSYELDSAVNTFTYNLSITIGTDTIIAPGTYTKQNNVGGPVTSFNLVALKEGDGTLIFATKVARLGTKGFNNEDSNYQIILPVPNQTTPIYYFFIDPYDSCPAGYGYGEIGEGLVYGYVTDNSTGLPIEDVGIYVSTVSNLTDSIGFYNFSAPYGYQYLVGIKSGYVSYVGQINISIGITSRLDFSMVPVQPYLENGTIHGFVFDNSSLLPLANATVSAFGASFITNESGEYQMIVLEGTHNIVAAKSGYSNYIGEVIVLPNSTVEHNISMVIIPPPENVTGIQNGTIKGIVFDNSTLLAIGNVTISIGGVITYSNGSGNYETNITSGNQSIIAVKTGYYNHIGTVVIISGNITYYNISLDFINITEAGQGPGSGSGAGAGAGAGAGSGLGAGAGAGTGVRTQRIPKLEQPKEIVDYDVSVKRILKKIRVGDYIDVPVTISNYRGEAVKISFSIDGEVKPLIKLDKITSSIGPNEKGELKLTIFGYEEGVYSGSLVISGDIEEKIPIDILVYSKEKLPVDALVLRVTPVKKKVTNGEEFKYRVDLHNMLSEEEYPVSLSYYLNGIKNNKTIFIEKEDIVILTSFSLLKSFIVPQDLEPGDYTLDVQADYLGFTSIYKTPFAVVQPIYKYSLFGIIPMWIIFILLGVLSTGTFGFVVYKKKAEEKKRYKTKIDFTHLPQQGPRTAYVGQIAETNNKAYFDIDLFQVHTLVAGASGSGKSVIAQDLVEEVLLKKVAVLVFDPTAQWTGFLRKCEDKKMLGAYKKFGMKKADALAFNGNVHQVENPRELLDIKRYMKPGEINIFVTNKLDTRGNEIFIANAIREIFHAHLPESKELIFLLVYDGIHSLLPKFGGSGEVFVQIERATREFRKWGVGLVLISQVLSDFPPEILANINTQIQSRTRDEKDLNVIKEEYGEEALKSLVKSQVGAGMVENSAYNNGKPYFISFRPLRHSVKRLSDTDLENYNKYNAITDDLENQIEQLEKEGLDVFDLKLELKLAQDKVKSGNFNMVGIYLDGLIPRIKSQWAKIGKAPKKKEVKLVSEDELKEGLKKAKDDKEKIEREKKQPPKIVKEGEPAKEAPSESPVVKNDEEQVNGLLKEAYGYLESGQKEKAMAAYIKINQLYKQLPKEIKAKIFNDCVNIQKKIAG